MVDLISAIREAQNKNIQLPFSVYSSVKEQKLLNVPIAKPLLIVVLNGNKSLGKNGQLVCETGEFIFLSNHPAINMRNIPKDKAYFALLIEFDYQDISEFQNNVTSNKKHYVGKTNLELMKCLQQFIESTQWAPKSLWPLRKREIISLLCHLGHKGILSLFTLPQLKDRLHNMFLQANGSELSVQNICQQLAMSESTLRRKLKSEFTSIQAIKDNTRLGLALHLLQTTQDSIGVIAEKCGYQSQSRFTERFKKQFGLTPTELKKTQLTE